MVHSGKTANSSLVTSASGKCFYQWETNIAIFEMLIFVIVYYKLAMNFFLTIIRVLHVPGWIGNFHNHQYEGGHTVVEVL